LAIASTFSRSDLEGLLTPDEDDTDIARYAAWKIDDVISNPVATGFEVVCPELIYFLRYSREGLFPTWLLLIDGAAVVGA
jgi:hypothetical protein